MLKDSLENGLYASTGKEQNTKFYIFMPKSLQHSVLEEVYFCFNSWFFNGIKRMMHKSLQRMMS